MAPKKLRKPARRSSAAAPAEEAAENVAMEVNEANEAEALDFADVLSSDGASSAASDGSSDSGDFEARAARHRRALRAEAQRAAAEGARDIAARTAPATPLRDAAEVRLLGARHSAEELRDRIGETVRVLSAFAAEREEGRAREEYIALFREDVMALYEYNEFLTDAVLLLFPPAEAVEFFEAMERPRPTTVRVNTLKAKRRDLAAALVKRGMAIEPLEKWSKVGLQVFESNVAIAGTVEYLAGQYMLQSAVSFLPVMALAPQEGERVLDMAAAPGGKTTYIAQLMKNTGVLFANDVSEARTKALNANIQRLGVTNTIVTNYDGAGYEKVMRNFDRVLLDAPCTGSGIISRDKSIKTSKHNEDVQRASQQQRALLLSAIDATKVGGYVVYSTCSFLVEENEAVVDFAVRRRRAEIVEMGLPFGRPGLTKYRHHRFHESMHGARRFFPHVHNMDGFFVCKIKKLSDERPEHVAEVSVDKKTISEDRRAKNGKGVAVKRSRDEKTRRPETAPSVKSRRLSVPPPNTAREAKKGKAKVKKAK